jgi:hypothetical protein
MRTKAMRAGALAGLVMLLALVGCFPFRPATPVVVTPLVVVVTNVVTQVITPTPLPVTPTLVPTKAPVLPTPTATYDPLSAPIYYPLKDCVASRLHVGDIASVSIGGSPNGIRFGTDLQNDTVIAYAKPGSKLEIVNGPYCNSGWIVWFVRMGDGTTGYTPEGDGNNYWLFPTRP